MPLAPGDRVLVCSDGLFTSVSDEDLGSLMHSQTTPEALVDSVVELALARGGDDNVSAVVAEVAP